MLDELGEACGTVEAHDFVVKSQVYAGVGPYSFRLNAVSI